MSLCAYVLRWYNVSLLIQHQWIRQVVTAANIATLEGRRLEVARRLLLDVTRTLDRFDVEYHLEGGTLLGIVRDGDLLPWDKDLDISIPAARARKFRWLICFILRLKGWRVSIRHNPNDQPAWRQGDYRLFKVQNRRWGILRGGICLDVFVKYAQGGYVWWQAKKKIMRVPEPFYDGHDLVPYAGCMLKAPRNHEQYLELKYGNWRVPVKEWDCAVNEKTIIGNADTT